MPTSLSHCMLLSFRFLVKPRTMRRGKEVRDCWFQKIFKVKVPINRSTVLIFQRRQNCTPLNSKSLILEKILNLKKNHLNIFKRKTWVGYFHSSQYYILFFNTHTHIYLHTHKYRKNHKIQKQEPGKEEQVAQESRNELKEVRVLQDVHHHVPDSPVVRIHQHHFWNASVSGT